MAPLARTKSQKRRLPRTPAAPLSPATQTTATIYSLVGALNKIPVAIVGLLVFKEPTNAKNLLSIIIGLLAGVLFVQAKNLRVGAPAPGGSK